MLSPQYGTMAMSGPRRSALPGRPSGRLGGRVPELRDFLTRFRPAEAPGAVQAGVPADRARELEAEVGPVLALLAGTDAEVGRIIAQARRDAEQITADAKAEAAAIAAAAGRRAAAAREEAARQVTASARDEAAAALRDAQRQAARTGELAAQRMPALVGRTVDAIRRLEAEAA
jgi:vacuolar-type H+-ATPase subunit H